MQGVLIVVVGVGLMYLVLSGKMDCLIAGVRACSGSTSDEPQKAITDAQKAVDPKAVLNQVLSRNP